MRKQKLSAIAKSRKSARDLAAANRADRKAKRAENQRLRRDAKKKGKKIDGLDFDHKSRTFKSIKSNRGNDGEGTKKESGKSYKVNKSK